MIAAGWAAGKDAHSKMLSYLPSVNPPDRLEDEPASAVWDWWEPPSPMAFTPDWCTRTVVAAKAADEVVTANGTYYVEPLTETVRDDLIDRVKAANEVWWNLDITAWDVNVKHYTTGQHHPEHTDWHPAGGALRKLVAGVQLSSADSYTGGDFRFRWAHHDIALPRTAGTLTVFPGWIYHRVTPITTGERWALIVNGWGPPLR